MRRAVESPTHGVLIAAFAATAAIAALCLGTPLRAAERATLSNGFSILYDHRGSVDGRVRLYLAKGEDSYVDFKASEIAAVETVADVPTESVGEGALASSIAGTAPTAAARDRGKTVGKDASKEAALSSSDLREMLTRAGKSHNLDVDLLASLVQAESGGNVHAVSRTGARGLMQLMPGTAAGLGVEDSFEPEQNLRGGSAYLDAMLTRYNDNMALALAAYNAGPAAVDRYRGIPPYRETQMYVARVIHAFNGRVRAREVLLRSARATALAGTQRQQR